MRVDFYVIDEQDNTYQKDLIACKLIEKAYNKGHRIFVFCDNEQQAHHIDELLWTFKEESFIPHNLQGEGPDSPPPIQIGFDPNLCIFNDLLLNMSQTIPEFYTRFKRVLEIVTNETKEIAREHYRYYKQQRAQLVTHQI